MKTIFKYLKILFFIFIISTKSYSQDLGELVKEEVENTDLEFLYKLHKSQSKNLNASRGYTPPKEDTRSINEKAKSILLEKLNSYSNNVGLLVYAYHEGSFVSLLLNNTGKILIKKKIIEKEDLIKDVNNYCSYNVSGKLNRGAIAIATNNKKRKSEIEDYIFPFKKEILEFEHLIIIPALNLSNIPFASIELTDKKHLIDLMSYSIAPSFQELISSKTLNEKRGFISKNHLVSFSVENALFISNPNFDDESERNFTSLPGAEEEVKNITDSLGIGTYKILNGKDATFSNFYNDICNYDLLYFATHGISDDTDPLNKSFLALSKDYDGKSKLTAKDIQDIRFKCLLNAELVVLSACQTGLGKEHEAGVIGLTRAFHIAGSNHIVMSLWNVDDEKTAILMRMFFQHLKEPDKLMPHSAFRKAILEFKNEFKNPNYWSSFSIFGIPY